MPLLLRTKTPGIRIFVALPVSPKRASNGWKETISGVLFSRASSPVVQDVASPTLSLTMAEVFRREGVSKISLSNWRMQPFVVLSFLPLEPPRSSRGGPGLLTFL